MMTMMMMAMCLINVQLSGAAPEKLTFTGVILSRERPKRHRHHGGITSVPLFNERRDDADDDDDDIRKVLLALQ